MDKKIENTKQICDCLNNHLFTVAEKIRTNPKSNVSSTKLAAWVDDNIGIRKYITTYLNIA